MGRSLSGPRVRFDREPRPFTQSSGMTRGIRVDQIDHVELFVPDRCQAAEWYRRVLGFRVVPELADWANRPRGPLMISSHEGGTKLALFEGKPQGSRETAGFDRVAFRVDASTFVRFLGELPELDLIDDRGRRVTADLAVDHQKAYSIYFQDPFGHRLEITTYDYDRAREALDPPVR